MNIDSWTDLTAVKAVRFFAGYGQTLLSTISTLSLALSGIFFGLHRKGEAYTLPVTLLIAGIIVAILGACCIFLPPKYSELRDAWDRHKSAERTLNDVLGLLGLQCLKSIFPKDVNSSRISLYRLSTDADCFELICRSAEAEPYRTLGRKVFPKEQGLIGRAWASNNGVGVAVDLPEDREAWIGLQETFYGIPREVAEKMTMFSRSIAAIRMDNAGGVSRDSISVIVVIESMVPDLFDPEEAVKFRQRRAMKDLAEVVAGPVGVQTPREHDIR